MKYNIISINDNRKYYKDQIRKYVDLQEEVVASVEGACLNRDGKLEQHMNDLGLWFNSKWPLSVGEIGVWASNFLRWEKVSQMNEPLVVFEDDAVIKSDFNPKLIYIYEQLPDDWDFVSLWVPDNQRIDYRYNLRYNADGDPEIFGTRPVGFPSAFDYGAADVARVYQGYGMVATMYSPAGGKKLVELAKQYGLRTPVDCFLMQEAHKGALNGYAPKPDKVFVDYDWPETQIHNTEFIK